MSLILSGDSGVTFPNSTVQASAGSVLQVVQGTYSTRVSSSSSTPADTGLTATITPKFSTSKILVIVTQSGCYTSASNVFIQLQIVRNSTTLLVSDSTGSTATQLYAAEIPMQYLDSPATTSATTYKTQFFSTSNNASVQVQTSNSTFSSVITLMEIAA